VIERDVAELDQPQSLWNVAAASTPQADPLCCRTEWQLSFHEAFAPQRALVVREANGSLIAFARRRDPRLGALLEPVEAHWGFASPLLGADALALLHELLAEHSRESAPVTVLITGLEEGSPQLGALDRSVRRGDALLGGPTEVVCSASLAGGLDGFLARRSALLRKRLRQAARRAAQRGVSFERCQPRSAEAAAAAYARLLAIESRSWKGIERCGMNEPPAREFYAAMLQRLSASGSGRVIFARCDERDVGFVFGGVSGDRYRGQQFSFAEDFRALSLGNLLQVEQIRWLAEEGVGHYDMGQLLEYKQHWTERRTQLALRVLRRA
jgi:CelD/BcsL family acetyltransferase involved in cellulose biosynthesis